IGVMILLGRFFREKELFRHMILLLWLLLCCHLLKRNLVIPAEWIPVYEKTKEQTDVLERFLNQPLAAREIANNREKKCI
ncbi:MAG: hypothetical protein ACI4E2_06420, partial [Acetatifactor sp.]